MLLQGISFPCPYQYTLHNFKDRWMPIVGAEVFGWVIAVRAIQLFWTSNLWRSWRAALGGWLVITVCAANITVCSLSKAFLLRRRQVLGKQFTVICRPWLNPHCRPWKLCEQRMSFVQKKFMSKYCVIWNSVYKACVCLTHIHWLTDMQIPRSLLHHWHDKKRHRHTMAAAHSR